jgi:chromosome segregation ATPase
MRYKCVTIDGDVFDPSGTLTGGFTNNSNMILFKVKSLNDINKEINDLKVKNKNKMEQFEQ